MSSNIIEDDGIPIAGSLAGFGELFFEICTFSDKEITMYSEYMLFNLG
jgi:hypothetical protein